jgi:hypothetical protein
MNGNEGIAHRLERREPSLHSWHVIPIHRRNVLPSDTSYPINALHADSAATNPLDEHSNVLSAPRHASFRRHNAAAFVSTLEPIPATIRSADTSVPDTAPVRDSSGTRGVRDDEWWRGIPIGGYDEDMQRRKHSKGPNPKSGRRKNPRKENAHQEHTSETSYSTSHPPHQTPNSHSRSIPPPRTTLSHKGNQPFVATAKGFRVRHRADARCGAGLRDV